jgi:hypothetical protein
VDTVSGPLLVLDGSLCVQNASRSFFETFKVDRYEAIRSFALRTCFWLAKRGIAYGNVRRAGSMLPIVARQACQKAAPDHFVERFVLCTLVNQGLRHLLSAPRFGEVAKPGPFNLFHKTT